MARYDLVFSDDLDFYEKFTEPSSDEEQERLFVTNPDFTSGLPVRCSKMYLLRGKMFRRILRKNQRL